MNRPQIPHGWARLAYLVLWGLVLFALTPRFWETGGESWKAWAAARILRETGGFPVFSLGPLYVVYLQAFVLQLAQLKD